MRFVRWAAGIAVAVVLLAIAAALIATLAINPDRYKGEIQSAVRRETGRPFILKGHLRLTWFPWLGVRTGAARLGNPPGAGGGPDLLDWQSAAVRVRLLPLVLHRQLEIGRIRIAGADIHLRRGPDGEGNWDDLLARLHPTGEASSAGAAGPHASRAPAAAWGGLDLVNSSLDYIDERSGEHVSLTGWRLEVGPWHAGQPLSVRTSFLLHAEAPGDHASPGAGARAPLRLPLQGVRVSLDVPRLQVHAAPAGLGAPQFSLEIAAAKLGGAIEASRNVAG
ncbi:MAG: AsmA family protein, partial [Steroidobacteraceae bacterium]